LELAETALALERYRVANGSRYPNSLADLIPQYQAKPPADPFTGEPLQYKKTAYGYVLSVTAGAKDNKTNTTSTAAMTTFTIFVPPRAIAGQ
jgi:hypothetical protein